MYICSRKDVESIIVMVSVAFKNRTRDEVIAAFRESIRKKQDWHERVRIEFAELKAEAEQAKEDPFYRRGTRGMACEPTPMPQPVFKPGSFVDAIRKQRAHQRKWQEQVNRKLDEREEQHRLAMEKWQLEPQEA